MPNISGIANSHECSRLNRSAPLLDSYWLNPDEVELEMVKEREKESEVILGIDRRQDQWAR